MIPTATLFASGLQSSAEDSGQTLRQALTQATHELKSANVPEAQLDAEYLVAAVVGLSRMRLPLESGSRMSRSQKDQLNCWLSERIQRKPLAYILGEQPFMQFSLRVAPAVLIPRPETELLDERAFRFLDTQNDAVVIDVGTGSGAIALSLSQHPNAAETHAIDISAEALTVAMDNGRRTQLLDRISWHLGDLLEPIKTLQRKADLIVANLPYVSSDEMEELQPEVRWEPRLALDGGSDGLYTISRLVRQAQSYLNPQGLLLLEIGATQGARLLKQLANSCWTEVAVSNDLAGLPRFVSARLAAKRG